MKEKLPWAKISFGETYYYPESRSIDIWHVEGWVTEENDRETVKRGYFVPEQEARELWAGKRQLRKMTRRVKRLEEALKTISAPENWYKGGNLGLAEWYGPSDLWTIAQEALKEDK